MISDFKTNTLQLHHSTITTLSVNIAYQLRRKISGTRLCFSHLLARSIQPVFYHLLLAAVMISLHHLRWDIIGNVNVHAHFEVVKHRVFFVIFPARQQYQKKKATEVVMVKLCKIVVSITPLSCYLVKTRYIIFIHLANHTSLLAGVSFINASLKLLSMVKLITPVIYVTSCELIQKDSTHKRSRSLPYRVCMETS